MIPKGFSNPKVRYSEGIRRGKKISPDLSFPWNCCVALKVAPEREEDPMLCDISP